ncbi:MAG: STAS domain-containing protein [Sporomusaceae bacterium]|nr:STAS domain-containing protein [Sporomusaceae bacterium]
MDVTVEDGRAVMRIAGEFQGKNAADVRDALLACLQDGHRHVVIDLSGVSLINATGIGVLVSVQQRLEALGGKLSLYGLEQPVGQVLERTRLHRSFDSEPPAES